MCMAYKEQNARHRLGQNLHDGHFVQVIITTISPPAWVRQAATGREQLQVKPSSIPFIKTWVLLTFAGFKLMEPGTWHAFGYTSNGEYYICLRKTYFSKSRQSKRGCVQKRTQLAKPWRPRLRVRRLPSNYKSGLRYTLPDDPMLSSAVRETRTIKTRGCVMHIKCSESVNLSIPFTSHKTFIERTQMSKRE